MIQNNPTLCNEPFFNSTFNFLKLGSLMSKLGIVKRSGASALEVFLVSFTSILYGYKNIYQYFASAAHQDEKVSRDAVYRLFKNPNYNWQALLLAIALKFIAFITGEVNSSDQRRCLVIDDTCIERPKSAKSELLAKIWDHVDGRFIRGYQNLLLGWTDGLSFFPLFSYLVSSSSKECRYFEANSKIDGRTRSGRLRKMATMKKPDLVVAMCKQALEAGIKAEYVLFDSWFFSQGLLARLHTLGLSVISLVKTNLKFSITRDGKPLTQRQIRALLKSKSPCRRRDLIGEIVAYYHGIKVKLVLVRNQANPANFVTIVSTNLELSAEEIIKTYIFRWKIETNFFAQKQYFGLDSECQAHNFDTVNAFIQLSNIRYAITEFAKRLEEDPRTMGEIIRDTVEILHVLPFVDAINKLLEAVNTNLRQRLLEANVIIPGKEQEVMSIINDTLSTWLGGTIRYIQSKITKFQLALS